jgi:hypothetical protein
LALRLPRDRSIRAGHRRIRLTTAGRRRRPEVLPAGHRHNEGRARRGLEGVQDLQRCGLVKGHRAWCPFASTIGLVSLTIARLPLQRERLRRPSLATCTTRWNASPRPCDAPKGWTSRPSRPKMHVQLSNHHRPSVRRAGPARQEPRQRIQSKGWRWRPLGCIACTVNGVRREAEVEPRLLIDDFLRESLGAHQHC